MTTQAANLLTMCLAVCSICLYMRLPYDRCCVRRRVEWSFEMDCPLTDAAYQMCATKGLGLRANTN